MKFCAKFVRNSIFFLLRLTVNYCKSDLQIESVITALNHVQQIHLTAKLNDPDVFNNKHKILL